MMLQHLEYGTGTPSSVAPVLHPEDAQPNEQVNRRNRNLPPRIANTAQPTRGNANFRGRGGYRGRGMSQGGWTQYAVRGRGSQPNRGGRSSSRHGPILEHWSVTESRQSGASTQLDPTVPLGASAHPTSLASSSSSSRSRHADDRSRSPNGWYSNKESLPAKRRCSQPPYVSLLQTSATPPAPETSRNWMLRSRSPTPKLPPCPIKRRKLDHIFDSCDDAAIILPGRHQRKSFTIRPATPEEVVEIKEEPRSPSPLQRKLVTESCAFYPLPETCKKSNVDYQQNRRKFFQEKNRYLISMGLKKTKVFFRDDGLVIEWTSKVPVWSDTLQPEIPDLATAIQLAHTINCDLTSSNQRKRPPSSQAATDEPPSKKPSSNPSKCSRKSNASGIKIHWASGLPEDQLEIMSRLGSSARKPPAPVPRPQLPPIHAQVPKTKMTLPTRRHGVLPKQLSASAAPAHGTPVAFSPRDSGFGSRVSPAPPPILAACAASPSPTPTIVVNLSSPLTKRVMFKPTNPPRRPQASSSSPSSAIPPEFSVEAAGPKSASSSRRSATPESTANSQSLMAKLGLPGAPAADSSIGHPVVLKRIPKPQISASSAPWGGFFQLLKPVAGLSNSNSTSLSLSTPNATLTSSTSKSASDSDPPSVQKQSNTQEFKTKKEDIVQQLEWEPRPPIPAEHATSYGLASTTNTPEPATASGTSLSGQASQVSGSIPCKSTTPLPVPLPRSCVDVHRSSPPPCLVTPADNSFTEPARVDSEAQVRASVLIENGQEKTKDPDIEREPTEDVDLGDADCIAQELLCRTPERQEDEEFERPTRVESSSTGDDEEEEGDELVALSTEYLQQYIHLFDTNRSGLELAYAQDALFSCRVHHLQEPSSFMGGLFAPEVKPSLCSTRSGTSASIVIQGRQQITNRLLLMGPYQFGARGVSGIVYYDAVLFGSGSGGRASGAEVDPNTDNVLVTMHGEVVNANAITAGLDHVLTVDQSFVLRRKSGDEDDASVGLGGQTQKDASQVWPLVAISHQMTIRAASLLAAERLEELLPWIQDIL